MVDVNGTAHLHQPIWISIGSALVVVGGVVATVYATRATGFDWLSGPMWISYVTGALAVVCLAGAIRGWRFPMTRTAPISDPSVGTRSMAGRGGIDRPRMSVAAIQPIPSNRRNRFGIGPLPAEVKEQLVAERAAGFTLRSQISSIANPISVLGFFPKTTEADVITWEERVARILEDYERKLVVFLDEIKTDPLNFAANAFVTPLERRMNQRLRVLDELIEESD